MWRSLQIHCGTYGVRIPYSISNQGFMISAYSRAIRGRIIYLLLLGYI